MKGYKYFRNALYKLKCTQTFKLVEALQSASSCLKISKWTETIGEFALLLLDPSVKHIHRLAVSECVLDTLVLTSARKLSVTCQTANERFHLSPTLVYCSQSFNSFHLCFKKRPFHWVFTEFECSDLFDTEFNILNWKWKKNLSLSLQSQTLSKQVCAPERASRNRAESIWVHALQIYTYR